MTTLFKTTKVWVSPSGLKHVDMNNLSDPENEYWLYNTDTDMADVGYTLVGEADISYHFLDRATVTVHAVDALKVQLQEVRAEAEKKAMEISEKINQLLAIANGT